MTVVHLETAPVADGIVQPQTSAHPRLALCYLASCVITSVPLSSSRKMSGPGSGSGPWTALRLAVNTNRSRDAEGPLSPRTHLILEILMVLMCVGAVTGNILVIVIVAATKTFHSVTSVLIMNLAVSDLLVGAGVMPFIALSLMNSSWEQGTDLCLYVGYTSSVYCTASVLTLAAIALDRYYSIVDCLHYTSRCTLWRTSVVVLWIWLQALTTSCPPLLGWGSVNYVTPMYNCAINWAISPSYTAFMAVLSYLIPAVVILFCYVNIVKVARSHARRIHTLEDSVQRSRNASTVFASGDPCHSRCGSLHAPSKLIYHVSGQFVSELSGEQGTLHASNAAHSKSTSRRLFSFLTQTMSPPSLLLYQQNQHGLVRLFLVICAFFLCWTPYVGVSLVQATETAISGQSSVVPPFAVTFSYWLVLLNSDINPLLYALLSKRFQGAFQALRQKIRTRLGGLMGRGGEFRAEGGRNSEPSTLQTTNPIMPPSTTYNNSKYCSSVFTVSTHLKQTSEEQLYKMCHPNHGPPSCSVWEQNPGGSRDCLQVPPRPLEGSRLPFSALTKERQATFFYGQITVRVEHDVL
ncbi:5-hydroxytryptamine receptor 1D [Eucyclogobius newberryi]|uniref:5-hydroxytryptamine receptor 1D n=1 Tax=Eucyclogobius newberryi TaxID=166745 RepID=UPI003B5C8EDD